MKGVVLIDANIRMGMIRIGQYRVGTLDMKYHRTMWQCEGTVIFLGSAYIGSGTKLSISRGATLTFGDIFSVTGGSAIICDYAISFGKNCLLSWDILIMDTDFHIGFKDIKINHSNLFIRLILLFNKYSFAIYLTHSFIVYYVMRVVLKILKLTVNVTNPIMQYIILLPITFLLVYYLGKIFNRYQQYISVKLIRQ